MNLENDLRDYILSEHLPGEASNQLSIDDDLISSGILDSLAIMKLVTHLEQTYGITVGAQEVTPENFGSVTALAKLVAQKSGK